jgi:hypothetical protein
MQVWGVAFSANLTFGHQIISKNDLPEVWITRSTPVAYRGEDAPSIQDSEEEVFQNSNPEMW